MNKYNISKITNHYMKVARALREGKLTTSQLNEMMVKDVNLFESFLINNEITKVEFDSYLVIVNEFEDLFEQILNKDWEHVSEEEELLIKNRDNGVK